VRATSAEQKISVHCAAGIGDVDRDAVGSLTWPDDRDRDAQNNIERRRRGLGI
jgi:hypothetical protein